MSNANGNFTQRMMTMPPVETTKPPTYSPGLEGVLAGSQRSAKSMKARRA